MVSAAYSVQRQKVIARAESGCLRRKAARRRRDDIGLIPTWTLCVEVFVLPRPARDRGRARGQGGRGRNRHALAWELWMLGALAIVSLAWRGYASSSPDLLVFTASLAGLMSWFCAGMLLAVLQVSHPTALVRMRGVLARPELSWPAVGRARQQLPRGSPVFFKPGDGLRRDHLVRHLSLALAADGLAQHSVDRRQIKQRLLHACGPLSCCFGRARRRVIVSDREAIDEACGERQGAGPPRQEGQREAFRDRAERSCPDGRKREALRLPSGRGR